ncbi:hypothetical protein [Natronorarus salvus]|uniref:hypothetical protein n=1 Tax=Natronorarus salvus TaxID=3117733 RepID=UPI002F266D94
MIELGGALLSHFERLSLYNSPYPAHDQGCAIDLYPGTEAAPSPVSGTVLDTRSVRAPPKPYAEDEDHLILIEVDSGVEEMPEGTVARTLHVEPSVETGDRIEVGDRLGRLVRAGFFAPWVANHVHLGFRRPDANPYRASGSLRLSIGVPIEPVAWDGTGTVCEVGETYVVLDAPTHPDPGERWIGIADDSCSLALDGGLPHYDGGGAHGNRAGDERSVDLLGEHVGVATGRDLAWDEVVIRVNGEAITGLSLFLTRIGMGAKLVCPGHGFSVGDRIEVDVRRDDADK